MTNEAADAESEIDDARVKVSFDEAQEDATVQDISSVLDILCKQGRRPSPLLSRLLLLLAVLM